MRPLDRATAVVANRWSGTLTVIDVESFSVAAEFDISRPAVSQHLRVLEEADLVNVRPEGTRRYYRARPDGLAELRTWIDQFWSAQLGDLKREVEQEMWRRSPGRSDRSNDPTDPPQEPA